MCVMLIFYLLEVIFCHEIFSTFVLTKLQRLVQSRILQFGFLKIIMNKIISIMGVILEM